MTTASDARAGVLEAAVELFAQHGYDGRKRPAQLADLVLAALEPS